MRPTRGAGVCLFLSLIGIGLAGYLTYLHLGLVRGELLGGAACSGSGAFNCHAVTSGPWSRFLGMPLALWGILGYVTVLALSLLAQQSSETAARAMVLIALLSSFFVAVDLALLALMAFVIRYYCLFCLLTYAVNLLILMVALCAAPKPWKWGSALAALAPSRQQPAAWLFWAVVLTAACGVGGVHAATVFVTQGSIGNRRNQIRDFILKQRRVSLDVSTDPRIGDPRAPLQLVEFSDFFCPACQRASKLNTILLANYRRDASFVFKNYPLDTSCNDKIQRMVHPGACQVAAAAECANAQGRFWPFHDLIFEKGLHYPLSNLEADAQRLGLDGARFRECLESGEGMEAVKRDIAEAAKAAVASTPTYVINGIPMAGGLSPVMFDELVAVLRESGN